jgi:hypothetical protein
MSNSAWRRTTRSNPGRDSGAACGCAGRPKKDAAAGAMELFRDLRAGGAGADHQHRAGWKLSGFS